MPAAVRVGHRPRPGRPKLPLDVGVARRAVDEEHRAARARLSGAPGRAWHGAPTRSAPCARRTDRRSPCSRSGRLDVREGAPLLRRGHRRGHHRRPGLASRSLRHLSQLDLPVQQEPGRRRVRRTGPRRAVRALGERPPRGRPDPHRGGAGGHRDPDGSVDRPDRGPHGRSLRAPGQAVGKDRDDHRAPRPRGGDSAGPAQAPGEPRRVRFHAPRPRSPVSPAAERVRPRP